MVFGEGEGGMRRALSLLWLFFYFSLRFSTFFVVPSLMRRMFRPRLMLFIRFLSRL